MLLAAGTETVQMERCPRRMIFTSDECHLRTPVSTHVWIKLVLESMPALCWRFYLLQLPPLDHH